MRNLRSLAGLAAPFIAGLWLVACGDDGSTTGGNGGGGSGAGAVGGQGGEGGTGGLGGGGGAEAGGGSGAGAPVAPPLRNPVDMDDETLAWASLALLGYEPAGATEPRCTGCHSLSEGLLNSWDALTNVAEQDCFADVAVATAEAANAALACFRAKPANPDSEYHTSKLGIYASAAHLPWFQFLFNQAFETDPVPEHEAFKEKVLMPKVGAVFTQGEFDIVAEWFARGMPYMADIVEDPPGPGDCVPQLLSTVPDHVALMATTGWRAQNQTNGILMHGCVGAATPLDCLASYSAFTDTQEGAGWTVVAGTRIKLLRTINYESSYWTRSSADGRYVGHGGGIGANATIVDLADDQEIPVTAFYDPAFFPDNSGFLFQDGQNGAETCTQSILAGAASITFDEPECSVMNSVGLYQHVGRALGGGDYWAINGQFVSDDGGHGVTPPFPANFGGNTVLRFTPMVFDGTNFVQGSGDVVSTPFQGDSVLSPSGRLIISRVASNDWAQNGFAMKFVSATPSGGGYDVALSDAATYCINGGKPAFSFDERWIVIHRYIADEDATELGFPSAEDPGFQPYRNEGGSNLYLIDLGTGQSRRITNVQPGQYAFSPHFRSDGWIYFMLRQPGEFYEHILASDAALVLE